MTAPSVFDGQAERYDTWFDRHPWIYRSELNAVRQALPERGRGLEVGVGSGRFAGPLKIPFGVDVSLPMLILARQRGVAVSMARAERLPFCRSSFDYAVMVTTICFLDDIPQALAEVRRILKPHGQLVIGFVDRESYLGQRYEAGQAAHVFYHEASFFSAGQILNILDASGFGRCDVRQTVFETRRPRADVDPVRPGHGHGAFVVIRARRGEDFHECCRDRGIQ